MQSTMSRYFDDRAVPGRRNGPWTEPELPVENSIQMNENGTINIAKSGDTIYYGDYRVILNIFKTAYFHIFGELFIDEKLHVMDPSECQSTLGNGDTFLLKNVEDGLCR